MVQTVPLDYFKLFYMSSYSPKPYVYNPKPATRAPDDVTTNEERTSFHSLPKELRDMVLGLVLLEPSRRPWEICLSHRHNNRGAYDIQNGAFSPERLMFSTLVLVSHPVKEDAIDFLNDKITLTCWMPLTSPSPGTVGIRTYIAPYCVCPLLLRHATKLHVRRGYEEIPETFEISLVGDDKEWEIERHEADHEPRELRKLMDGWLSNLQKLLQTGDVRDMFSKTNLRKFHECLEDVGGASTKRRRCKKPSKRSAFPRRSR